MSVMLEEGVLAVRDESNRFYPTASEIFSVLFEGARSIRGIETCAREFQECGIEFHQYLAELLIVVEYAPGPDGPVILLDLRARLGEIEALVSHADGKYLDYAIGKGHWLPLPPDSPEAANVTLGELGLGEFGSITLAQYMKLARCQGNGISILDRTADAFSAQNVAANLGGALPMGLVGRLYNYQLEGFRWLSFMVRGGLGGIIADEMGLGKTVQVISVILEAVSNGSKPNLVVAPTTVLENWRRELSRFAPSLQVLVHSGSRRTGFPSELARYDVVICSFDTAVVDISLLRSTRWNLVILDEAQNIRNPSAKRTLQLKTIPRACAVAVTGTPVENRLRDIWSITDFVLPALLGPLDEFEQRYPESVDGASLLERIISPLVLRRSLAQVGGDLPERIDIPQALQLDAQSADAYESIRAAVANEKGATLEVLQKLRMFCTHPWLTHHFEQTIVAADCSVKMLRLLEIMEEIVGSRGKAIIFTSYSGSVDLIRSEISARLGIYSDFIDGRVKISERQTKVDSFTAQNSSAVLVLNPKAAGVGLNITAANHVIHYNPEWNPAVEDQASARAHRRGQTRTVTVHRLFYINTVEEIIEDRMRRKRELATAAIVGTDGREQDMADILRALRISPVAVN